MGAGQSSPGRDPGCGRRLAEAIILSSRTIAFSPASLEEVENSVSGYHRMDSMGWLKPEWEARAIDVAHRAGCYLGEVIIRNLGGQWRRTEETSYARLPQAQAFPLVVQLPNGNCCHPLARPFKLLECGRESESLVGFYAGIESLSREAPEPEPPPPHRPWWRFWR